MAEYTKIQWCDHTLNFWIGCTKVSDGCKFCYAERENERHKWVDGFGARVPRHKAAESTLKQLYKWDRKAASEGVRRKVFSNSLSDFFDPEVPMDWRHEALRIMTECPNLDFLVLTKRPKFAREYLMDNSYVNPHGEYSILNLWIGASAEDQATIKYRTYWLIRIPAVVRFLSLEPLLEEVTIEPILGFSHDPGKNFLMEPIIPEDPEKDWMERTVHNIDWVITGGESDGGNSDQKTRISHPEWFWKIRKECFQNNVHFFFKQWGAWSPEYLPDSEKVWDYYDDEELMRMYYWGKKDPGRKLYGREYNEIPKVN